MSSSNGRQDGIPAEASVHKYDDLRYVGFAEEVRAEDKQLEFPFDYIIGPIHPGMVVRIAKVGSTT